MKISKIEQQIVLRALKQSVKELAEEKYEVYKRGLLKAALCFIDMLEEQLTVAEIRADESTADILARLVELKDYKAKYGKDEHYQKEQSVLWDIARKTVSPYEAKTGLNVKTN